MAYQVVEDSHGLFTNLTLGNDPMSYIPHERDKYSRMSPQGVLDFEWV